LSVQLPLLAAVVLLGPPIINGLARTRLGKPGAKKAGGDLNWARRPLIYTATALGLLALAAQAPRQVAKLAPVLLAILLGGVIPRAFRHLRRQRKVSRAAADELKLRGELRTVQMGWPRRLDSLVA